MRSPPSPRSRTAARFWDWAPGTQRSMESGSSHRPGPSPKMRSSSFVRMSRPALRTTAADELVGARAIVGTPDECAARLRELKATGIDSLIVPLAGRGRLETWRKIRDEILDQIIV